MSGSTTEEQPQMGIMTGAGEAAWRAKGQPSVIPVRDGGWWAYETKDGWKQYNDGETIIINEDYTSGAPTSTLNGLGHCITFATESATVGDKVIKVKLTKDPKAPVALIFDFQAVKAILHS